MKTILISGSNGFIANNFYQKFANKYNFIFLSHKLQNNHLTLEQLANSPELINSIDVVLNLAGANISTKRWSETRKETLILSRTNITRGLIMLFNQHEAKAHFISASAIGIYNLNVQNDDDTIIDYQNYTNFSQQLTKQWEKSALHYNGKLTITRFGVVLSSEGGAFPKMLRPFLFGGGGKLGNGSQYFPWIALTDLLNCLDWLIETETTGVYNLVSPQQITNSELSSQIASIWHRPSWLNLPAFLIKILFGQMGQELFLNSILVKPSKLIKTDFKFLYQTIDSCLNAIKKREF